MLRAIITTIMIIYSGFVFCQDSWPIEHFDDRRFKEDWSLSDWKLRDENSRNYSDRIKNIPLSGDKKFWFSTGGQVRVRYMGTIHDEFMNKNTGLFTLRARLHGDLHLGSHFRIYAEGIYSNTTNDDSERIGIGSPVTKGALLNLFSEFKFNLTKKSEVGIWVGRRELQTGHERLVSPGNWLNTRRSWDGGGFFIGNTERRVSAFWTKPVIVVPDGFSQRDAETVFWGVRYQSDDVVYESNAGFGVQSWSSYAAFHFEPYVYGLHRKNVLFEQGTQDEERYTIGALVSGPINHGVFNYEFEGAYQFGNFGSADLNAYALAAEFGVTPGFVLHPHFWLGFDYASGDADVNDVKLGTFDPMYPQAAAWFGEHGAMDRKNLVSYSFNTDFTPVKEITSRFTFWKFSRSEVGDAVYNTANGILREPGDSKSKDLGYSFQLSNVYTPHYQVEITATYNLWKPGKFFQETQSTKTLTQHFIMITAQYTF